MPDPLHETLRRLAGRLLAARDAGGTWTGELSGSALSTATAVTALRRAPGESVRHTLLIDAGLRWLVTHQNADGGWGDTVRSLSNPSTTLLACCALTDAAAPSPPPDIRQAADRGERWLAEAAVRHGLAPAGEQLSGGEVADLIEAAYGRDRTFSAPILAMAAMTGRLGPARAAWRHVRALPFELALCPQSLLRRARLPVVSYALPALIAIGLLRHRRLPSRRPWARGLRSVAARPALNALARIQPASGGFLEAAPLTSFVVMSLREAGEAASPVARRGVAFLAAGARADGSWPIDEDLGTWLTTLAIGALTGVSSGAADSSLPTADRAALTDELLARQRRRRCAYTGADPGGWAWTPRAGGVPDADDTAGALLSLAALTGCADQPPGEPVLAAARDGVRWLCGLQNRDGGIPTFCRGWGHLPFDRSSPDLTAHALRAIRAWRRHLDGPPDDQTGIAATDSAGGAEVGRAADRMARRALAYLRATQRGDGAWQPLWFGNEACPDSANRTYGTSRVLLALAGRAGEGSGVEAAARRGAAWLVAARHADGGWGGCEAGVGEPSIEETALAVEALAAWRSASATSPDGLDAAIGLGADWLVAATDRGRLDPLPAAPIGLYFARLWYFESLYPLVLAVAALGRVARLTETEQGEIA